MAAFSPGAFSTTAFSSGSLSFIPVAVSSDSFSTDSFSDNSFSFSSLSVVVPAPVGGRSDGRRRRAQPQPKPLPKKAAKKKKIRVLALKEDDYTQVYFHFLDRYEDILFKMELLSKSAKRQEQDEEEILFILDA
jgi:hypothetical protein